jgi:hypothetical protein
VSNFDELPETSFERLDRLAFERETQERQLKIQADRDIRVAKEKRKAERSTMWLGIAIALVVGSVLFSLVYAWWIIPDPPQTPDDFRTSEAGREQACIESGGGWVVKDLLGAGSSSDHGLCVFPGRSVR